jgi:uncharacterized protein YoxC
MSTFLLILSIALGLIAIGLGYIVYYLVNYISTLQEALDNFNINFDIIRQASENLLNNMRNIDSTGAFEADDEVGATFSELSNLVQQFNTITEEYAPKEKN